MIHLGTSLFWGTFLLSSPDRSRGKIKSSSSAVYCILLLSGSPSNLAWRHEERDLAQWCDKDPKRDQNKATLVTSQKVHIRVT